MKKKELEIVLQNVPSFISPKPNLEQYLTPANIVADIIFIAHQFNDINDKVIFDFGCGTGIFSIGAYITGAREVIGFDIDKDCIEIAKKYVKKNEYDISFFVKNVRDIELKCDTILMNPPFGAQKSNINIDRLFIEKGFEIGSAIYSLHLTKTIPFIKKLIEIKGGKIIFSKDYNFPIKWIFNFHKKKVVNYDVTLLKIKKLRKEV
jgi:putative methylase